MGDSKKKECLTHEQEKEKKLGKRNCLQRSPDVRLNR
jgi:hypothetical protein